MKGNAVLNVPMEVHHEPCPPKLLSQNVLPSAPPASHLGTGEMLASSCPKHREPPAAEWVEVTFNVLFTQHYHRQAELGLFLLLS